MGKYKYITAELAEKTDKKSIMDAYNAGNLSIVVYSGHYYFEGCTGRGRNFSETVRKEIKKHFPELTPLF